jgi:hypothetical protein
MDELADSLEVLEMMFWIDETRYWVDDGLVRARLELGEEAVLGVDHFLDGAYRYILW